MPRTVITGIVVMVVGTALVWWWLETRPERPGSEQVFYPTSQPKSDLPAVPAFAVTDKCIACHQRTTPAIVVQWSRSAHARNGHSCMACHGVDQHDPLAKEHEGVWIASTVTPRACSLCHRQQVDQFARSRHGLPAWAAMSGTDDFKHDPGLMKQYAAIEEIPRRPDGEPLPRRNALYDIEGPLVTPVACARCHSIGQPHPDGTAGRCQACHSRHEFSLVQARKPETCNNCHIGPDHPQFEIYMESKHGINYATMGHHWNWTGKPGTLTTTDFPAPTCQTCHMSGFGPDGTTHDVGDRLSLFLHEPISKPRPPYDQTMSDEEWAKTIKDHPGRQNMMKNACLHCHSRPFIEDEYRKGDNIVKWTNAQVAEATKIVKELRDLKLLTPQPFDERLEFTAFDLWHHWGRTAKFGAFMQGADYSQWHGAYELLKDMAELKEHAAELKKHAGVEAGATTQPDGRAAADTGPPLLMSAEIGHGPLGGSREGRQP